MNIQKISRIISNYEVIMPLFAGAVTVLFVIAILSLPLPYIPLFILMGGFAAIGGFAQRAYYSISFLAARLPGSLAIATCYACAAFGAMSGSSIATTAIFGRLSLPEMQKYGYDTRLSVGCIASAGTFASMIPPSMMFIIYAMFTHTSVAKLFAAGVVAGIMTATVYAIYIAILAKRKPQVAPMPPREIVDLPVRQKLRIATRIWPLPVRRFTSTILIILIALTSCKMTPPTETAQTQPAPFDQTQGEPATVPTDIPQADMPNPASAYCVEQGFRSEIRTAADGSQTGYCIFPDGSECEEWAYFRGECGPADQSGSTSSPTEIPTPRPFDLADYQGWWTYTHPIYNFSIMLPEDWVVEEITTFDPLMNHAINLHSRDIAPGVVAGYENIRMTFRRVGEDVFLWPTGVGAGEFISQGTLDVAGQPAQRMLLVCPTGEVTSIWYHQAEDHPNIVRGDMEFGFIFSGCPSHCEPGYSLGGKVQYMGELTASTQQT